MNWLLNFSILLIFIENDDISDENSLDEKIDSDANTANTVSEENVNSTNFSLEKVSMEQTSEETVAVEYQEAPSASAVPVPTFTPQQTHTVSSTGITAHSAPPQNLKTLPHGMYTILDVFTTKIKRYK